MSGHLSPVPPQRGVHELVDAGKERQVKVDYYGDGGTFHLGLLYPGMPKAKATVRLTIAQGRELMAAIDAACDAVTDNLIAYRAEQERNAA